jgi:hypothetical protein
MKNFISNKIVAVLVGNIGALALIAFGVYLFTIGSELLQANSVFGALLISLLPVTLFLSALVYQNYVVGNCRQLSVVESDKCSHIQRSAILALKDAFDSARYVPMMLVGMTCVISLVLVSPAIGLSMINNQEIFFTVLGSLFISSQLYIGMKSYMLTVNAYNKLSNA